MAERSTNVFVEVVEPERIVHNHLSGPPLIEPSIVRKAGDS